jgi:hypothetical protein
VSFLAIFLAFATDLGSASLAKQCCAFLQKHQLIKMAEDFLCATPPNDTDAYIISWIMNEYSLQLLCVEELPLTVVKV